MEHSFLLQDWKFIHENLPDASGRGYDDTAWQEVVVPHDWSVSFPFSTEHSSGTGYLPGGTGWYRTRFALPKLPRGTKVFITFDGVYKNSQVWCNSNYLGLRPFGYASFTYDISEFVFLDGRENAVAVKVTHEDIADSRWFTGSGLYRKVSLRVCPPVFAPEDSLFFTATPVGQGDAEVRLQGDLRNDSDHRQEAKVLARLVDDQGMAFELPALNLGVDAGGSEGFFMEGTLRGARLWSPETPNLYTLEVSVQTREGEAANRPIRAGIRSFSFDPDQGFFFNGQNRKLKGVCVHHDAGCLGAAVWPAVWQRRLQKLKDMGCDAIRMAHNPHMPELYDLCDEMGFFVMDEAFDEWEGVKNKWAVGHNVYPPRHQGYFEAFPAWHEADLTMMVKRDRNHPSLILWSVGNEIDYPNDPYCHPLFNEMVGNNDSKKPKAEMLYSDDKPNMERLAVLAPKLSAIVRRHDATRPVLTAAAFPELSSQLGFFDSFDVVGYNYKEHLYPEDHRRFPKLPILGSENGQSLEAWQAVTKNDYISGQFLWTGIDFLGETGGWPCHGSQAGLLDVGGFEKPGYFRRRSFWSETPVAHLAAALPGQQPGRAYQFAPGEKIQVFCYTNQPEAELFLNGESLGKKANSPDQDSITWEISYTPGTLRVVAGDAAEELRTPLPPASLAATLWPTPQHLAYEGGAYALRQVEIHVLDGEGRACPLAEPMLNLSLTGPAKLLGIENGNLFDTQEYALPRRRAYQGRAIAYVLVPKAGGEKAALQIESPGFASLSIDL